MGVRGLLSHCLARRDACVHYVDLVELGGRPGGIELLVDFYAFLHFVTARMWRGLAAATGNHFLRLSGAEYAVLDRYVSALVTALRQVGVRLVMYVDGARGSCPAGAERKLATWRQRHAKDLAALRRVLAACTGVGAGAVPSGSDTVRGVLLEVQVFATLRRLGCEVVQCVRGEADAPLADALRRRAPTAVAILSNDSDFLLFDGARLAPHDLFDLEDDLRLAGEDVLPVAPRKLIVGVISSDRVVEMMRLRGPRQLVDLGILLGNDFTGPLLQSLSPDLSLPGKGRLDCTIKWLQEHDSLESHPGLAHELRVNAAFAAAVHQSRLFYSGSAPSPPAAPPGGAPADRLRGALEKGVRAGRYPVHVMAMNAGFYWHRLVLEDCGAGAPCAEVALTPLRAYIYRIVMPFNSDCWVTEWGRTPQHPLTTYTVYPVEDGGVPTLDRIHSEKMFQNLRTFTRVMLHLEPEFPYHYLERYGRRRGFNCHLLRYFACLNARGANLRLRRDEFTALVAAVARSAADDDWYRRLAVPPSVRCVTVLSWFQVLYRLAYFFLAKLLHISDEFPEPKDLICGSVWTAFYMTSTAEGQCSLRSRPPPSDLRRINGDMQRVLDDQKHIIPHIVEGIFESDGY